MSEQQKTELRRNDKNRPLIPNGQTRRGQFSWHNEECMVEDHGLATDKNGRPYRMLWCATHGQWAYEYPYRVIYEFKDGERLVRNL